MRPVLSPAEGIGSACWWVLLVGVWAVGAWANAPVEVRTGDGLAVRLAPASQVTLAGETLPTTGQTGGLLVRDARRQPRPNLLPNPGFEGAGDQWTWAGPWAVDPAVAHEGRASLRLDAPGPEPAPKILLQSAPAPVQGDTEYVVSLWARGRGLAHFDRAGHRLFTWSVSARETDEAGAQTTPACPVTFPAMPPAEFDWTWLRTAFRTHPRTRRVQIVGSVAGGEGTLWLDDLWLSEVGSGPEVAVGGTFHRSGQEVRQEAALRELGLTVQARYRSGQGKMEAEVEVADPTGQDRAVQVGFRLPVDLSGWRWEEHLRAARTITGTESYHHWFELGPGRFCNVYPFSAVTGLRRGIGLGVPMDVPRIFRMAYEPTGLTLWFDLGLSPETKRFPGQARVAFVLYTYPARWGFRAATRKYHDLYPQFFERRAARCGNWGLSPHLPRNPEDFAMRYGGAPLAWANQHAFSSLIYNEPWGWWMPWDAVKEPGEQRPQPSYQELLARLQQATQAAPEADAGFMLPYIPMGEIARAALNGALHDEQGRPAIWEGSWTTFGSNTWLQHYPINPDPDLRPLPNRDSLTRQWVLEPFFRHAERLGLTAGGAYIDSVSATLVGLFPLENYRRSHWQVAKQPLVFNPVTREVCQLYLFPAYDFLSQLAADLHEQNKLMCCNMAHGYGLTFLGHLFDLIGREGACDFLGVPYLGGFPDSDALFSYLHVLSGQKPVSFYDYDYWRTGFGDAGREHRLRQCLFHGVFPGLPWVNDAEAAEGSESMRALARKYFPALERVAEAGWEPITGAATNESAVKVERYGDGKRGNLHFTLRNETSEPLTFTFTIHLGEVGLGPAAGYLAAEDLLSGTRLDVQTQHQEARMGLILAPDETLALAVGAPMDLARPHLQRAAELLGLLRDLAAFNSTPAPRHSRDLRPGWYVDRLNSRGAYRIEEDPAWLDLRGRPAIRLSNQAPQDCGIYFSGPYDLRVKAGEEYELLLRYRVASAQRTPQEGGGLAVQIGFSEYFGRLLEEAWQEAELPVEPSGEEGWQRVRITVPEKAYRMVFRFVLRGNDTTVWLADQRLTQADEADEALTELEQRPPAEAWLARQFGPELRSLVAEVAETSDARAAAAPTATEVKTLRRQLGQWKAALWQRYPPTSEPDNREAWQRLNDALDQVRTAHRLLMAH